MENIFSLSSITMLLDCVSSHDSKILIDLKQVLLSENRDPATYVFTKPKKFHLTDGVTKRREKSRTSDM